MSTKVKSIRAREILSAADFPTIETTVVLENGVTGKASVPFGTSFGKYEAMTLTDNDPKRYGGFGMLKAMKNVNEVIAPEIVGIDVLNQKDIDAKLISLDSTKRKENLGGNSILSVSLACARTAGFAKSTPLYQHIREAYGIGDEITALPKPMMVVMEGGKHADDSTDFQEYLIAVHADTKSAEKIRMGTEVYHVLGKILDKEGFDINVGLEGAYAATGVKSNKKPLEYIKNAIITAGYDYENQISISIDPAASEFYKEDKYHFAKEGRTLNSSEIIDYYKNLYNEFRLISIEDGIDQDDWESWIKLKKELGDKAMIVGDDLTVTQTERVQKAIELDAINSLIIKPNQVGTLSETMAAIMLAKKDDLKIIVSHRGGGETTDTFIIDLAVCVLADYVKVGPSRGERVDKYNRLMEIGEELGL